MSVAPELIGHRGAPRERPENSLAAMRRALELGADAVELDVHATRDGVVVVHHDASTRSRGEGLPSRAIAELTHAELAAFPLPDGSPIPTLREILEAVGARATVYIEIKGRDIEPAVVECIASSGSRCAVHSFDHRVPSRLRQLSPDLPTGILSVSYLLDPAMALRAAGARDYWQEWTLIDEDLVRRIHDDGGRVIAWTVNTRRHADRLVAMGVDGICTDVIPEVAPAMRSAR
jgi:glycerophosphoryl diester phosphodiesterase